MDDFFEAAVDLIDRNLDKCESSGPQPEVRIRQAEKLLGFALPSSYRSFLARYGVLSFGPYEIYGIFKAELETGPVPNMVWLTLTDRASAVLPPSLVEFYHDGMGFYVLDTAEGDDPPVRTWDTRYDYPRQRGEVIADSFGAFLLELVTRHLGAG